MKSDQPILNHVRKIRRNTSRFTQQGLADASGVPRQTIVAIEKGNYNPSIGIVLKVALAPEPAVEDLVEVTEE